MSTLEAPADRAGSDTEASRAVVNDFSIPWVVMVYIAAQIVLGLHLYHGGWSLLQSLGLTHPAVNEKRRTVAQAIAALVVIGNISIPVAVLAGFVTY